MDPADLYWEDVLIPVYFANPPASNPLLAEAPSRPIVKLRKPARDGMGRAESSKPPSPLTLLETLGSYALEVMSATGLRQHVISILVENESISMVYFDRSGGLASSPCNLSIDANQEVFFQAVSAIVSMSRDEFGFIADIQPKTTWPSLGSSSTLGLRTAGILEADEVPWPLVDLKHINQGLARGLVGRGTMVYDLGDESVLKLSWQPTERPISEAFFFDQANNHNIGGLPRMLAWNDLAWLSKGIRGRLQPHLPTPLSPSYCDRVLRAIVFDQVFLPLQDFDIANHPIEFLTIYGQLILCMSHYAMLETHTEVVL